MELQYADAIHLPLATPLRRDTIFTATSYLVYGTYLADNTIMVGYDRKWGDLMKKVTVTVTKKVQNLTFFYCSLQGTRNIRLK